MRNNNLSKEKQNYDFIPSGVKDIKNKSSSAFKVGGLFLIMILIFILFVLFVKVLQEWEWGFVKDTTEIIGITIKNFEPFGITLGLLGILLSLFIFIYVKKENDDRQEEFQSHLTDIKGSVAEVINSYTSLTQVEGFTDRIRIIEEIYQMSRDLNNDLYIMTHSVNHGNILAHQVNAHYESNDKVYKEDIKTIADFYKKIIKPELMRIENLRDTIIDMKKNSKNSSKKIKIMVLEEEKYISMISNVANHHDIKLFTLADEDIDFNYENFKETYFKEIDNDKSDISDKKIFVDLLSKANEDSARLLEKNKSQLIDFKRVSQLPFQFIASVPQLSGDKMKCIVIFSNMFSGSTIATVTCFSSENERLINNLVKIYNKYEEVYVGSQIENERFRKIFNIKKGKEICFMMHETAINDGIEGTILLDCLVRFRDDVFAETQIKELFHKLDKDYAICKDFMSDREFDSVLQNYDSIVNIGLFGNKLTNYLSNEEKKGKRFFYIALNGNNKMICTKWGQNIPEEKWVQNVSNYHPNKSESFDLGVFAKVQINDKKSVIICGGCESYGTRKMGEYVFNKWDKMVKNEENFEKIKINSDYTKPEFISIYKIPHEDNFDHEIKLIHHYSN